MANCQSSGVGAYVASEWHYAVWGRLPSSVRRGVISLQGSHSLASVLQTATTEDRLRADALAQAGYVVICGDLAQTTSQGTFGNSTAQTRVGQLKTYVQGAFPYPAASGKVHLVAGSGGATAALNYARANPTLVASMYLIVPLVDLQDFFTSRTDGTVTQAEVNAAYGGSVAASYATHNPSASGNQAALAGVPMKLVYSTNDLYVPAATVTSYAALVNAAGGSAVAVSQGAQGHSGLGVDPVDVARFFNQNR